MKKLKQIFFKLIYVFEFILCLLEAFLGLYILKDILIGQLNYFKISIALIIGIIIAIIIILSLKKSEKKIEKIFITFAIPISILYLVFLIPTYVPDENAHAIRAYEVASGEFIIPYDENGITQTYIPKDLEITGIDGGINNYIKLIEQISTKSNHTEMKKVFNPSQSYFPLLYVFSGIGFFIGKIFSLNFMITMYIARTFNLIVGLILGYYSIKIIPFGKLLLLIYMFLPMFFQQQASMSADSLVNSIAIFFIAYNLNLIYNKSKFNIIEKALYMLLAAFLSIAKTVYLPLVFLSILLFKNKKLDKKNTIKFVIITIILSIILGVFWYLFSGGYKDQREYFTIMNVNGTEQIKWILKKPISYLKVLVYTCLSQGDVYLEQFIGAPLGWLNIPIEGVIIKIFLILLIITPFLEKTEYNIDKKDKIYYLLLFMAMAILAITGLYIGWTTVGGKVVLGFQGRYLIPIMLLPLICLCVKNKHIEFKHTNMICALLVTILNLGVIVQVMRFFI